MAKLFFRYGVVSSAKTMNLLAVAHNYETKKENILLIKPAIDNRFGEETIKTRAGLSKKANVILAYDELIPKEKLEGIKAIIVDEAQFLSSKTIEQLSEITSLYDIPVMCYGLRTDFKRNLFEGSKRLLELADKIEEIKQTCYSCNKKAIFNLKKIGDKVITEGDVVDLGAEEKYLPICNKCYLKAVGKLR